MTGDEKVCAAIRARFSELVEGDLGDDARREAEAHLAGCEQCAASLARFREAIAALGRLARPEPPADLPDRIDRALDRLDRSGAPAARPGGRRRMAQHAVAALLVAGIIVGIIRVVPEVGAPHHPGRKAEAPLQAPAPADEEFRMLDRAAPLAESAVEADAAREGGALEKKTAGDRRDAPETLRKPAAAKSKEAEEVAEARSEAAAAPARSLYAQRNSEPDGAASARALLLAARPDADWVAAVRDLALARPDDMAAAWAGIDAGKREAILEVWRRAQRPPGLGADLARAREQASAPAAREAIEAFAGAAPAAAP